MNSELLKKKELGSFYTTPLGVGTSRLGAFWQKRSVAEGEEALSRALDLGVSLIDTADVYSRGISERIVGKVIAHRDDVAVMTKVGLIKTPRGVLNAQRTSGAVGLAGLKAATKAATCFEPDYVETSALACMKRQKKDELDILLLHEPTAETFADQRLVEKLNGMQERGMIRAWGASVREEEDALAALDTPGLSWLQVPTNLSNTHIADQVAAHENKGNVTVVGIAVLGDGSLLPRVTGAGYNRQLAVAALVEGAYAHPAIDAVLLGMSRPAHVSENLAALARGADSSDITAIKNVLES